MSKYDVTFTETVVYTIRVDAIDEDEASENANKIATHLFSKFNNECVEWENYPSYPSHERIEEVSSDD